jgi:hypothetical protein
MNLLNEQALEIMIARAVEDGVKRALEVQETIHKHQLEAAMNANAQVPFSDIKDANGKQIPPETIRRQCKRKNIPIVRYVQDLRQYAIPAGRAGEIVKYKRIA